MNRVIEKSLGVLLAGFLAAGAQAAHAFSLDSVAGAWTSVSPAGVTALTGVGTGEIRWGTPAAPLDPQSGLGFMEAAPLPVGGLTPGSDFYMGSLTHYNFPIFGTPADGAVLHLDVGLSSGMSSVSAGFDFSFGIEETPNALPCPAWQISGTPCDDRITILTPVAATTFVLDGITYALQLGFYNPGGVLLPQFITSEGMASSGDLLGNLVAVPAPAPGTVALLALGLLGMGWMRRRIA